MDMSKYKGMFISETKEHLQSMNQLIISLEKDPSSQENIEALFREAHSIKGMSASMGYNNISELSHKMEDMMDLFRKGELTLDSDAVDLLFEGLDLLELMVKGVETDESANVDYAPLLLKMDEIKDGKKASTPSEQSSGKTSAKPVDKDSDIAAKTSTEAIKETPGVEQANISVKVKIDGSSQMPGMRGFLVYKKLTELGKIIATDPDIEDVKKGNFDSRISFLLSSEHESSQILEALQKMAELASVDVRTEAGDIQPGGGSLSLSKTENPDFEGSAEPVRGIVSPSSKSYQVRTVRVTTDLLDSLINIVGEMIIARSRLFEIGKDIESPLLHEGLTIMSSHIRDLHGQVMSVRMTPIESLMERLPRVVRDLARKEGKKVELTIEGKDIELDRAIVEEMGDPLVHILRNCVDHGIEPVADRESLGKNPIGRIRIRAMREKDQVYINIEDDGRGMDVEKIKRKAVARGIIKKERVQTISDRDVFMLVCHSGLSTADKVTDVSGRGVGMDAVKNVVDSIGGSLDIDSKLGKGTNITMKLPLTVAIMHVLLIRLNTDVLAVPISKIIRTLEVDKNDLKRSQKQMAVMVGEELIPLLSLKKILNMKGGKQPTDSVSVVVVEMKNKQIGLVVDAFIEQQEAFVKPLDPPLEWLKGFSGATILGDGSVVFVLDIPNLL